MDSVAGKQVIKAEAPYAEVVTYSVQIKSLSHGAGAYAIAVEDYAEVPGDIAKKIIQAAQEDEE
jgi:elongation factor G